MKGYTPSINVHRIARMTTKPIIWLLSLLVFTLSFKGYAQISNYVPNASFEDKTGCPTSLGQMTLTVGWVRFANGTPDFYDSCGRSLVASWVNRLGSQVPASGSSYAGCYTYTSSIKNYKEYIGREITPLTIGVQYEVSMSVSLADRMRFSANDLGVFFYQNGKPIDSAKRGEVINAPQISFKKYGNIRDTTNWIRVVDTFTADSAYKYIVIGGFDRDTSTRVIDTVTTNTTGTWGGSYYYVDSVVIKILRNFNVNYSDTLFCGAYNINVPYTVNNSAYFQSGNVFTLQLSDVSGSFSNPINIGSKAATTSGFITATIPSALPVGGGYRLRLISSNRKDTVVAPQNIYLSYVQPVLTSTVSSPLCVGDTAIFSTTASPSANSYSWTGPSTTSLNGKDVVINNVNTADSGDYIVTAILGGCVSKDTVTLDVKKFPVVSSIVGDTTPCPGGELNVMIVASPATTTFSWVGPNGFTAVGSGINVPDMNTTKTGVYKFIMNNVVCTANDSLEVSLDSIPLASINVSGELCEPATIQLSSKSSVSAYSYLWEGPNGYTDTGSEVERINATVTDAGFYSLEVTATNGCTGKDSVNVMIGRRPRNLSIIGIEKLCEGDTMLLQASSSDSNVMYQWFGPSGFTANTATIIMPEFTVDNAGDYRVIATLGECKTTADIEVGLVTYELELGNDTLLCEGTSMFIEPQVDAVSYLWSDGSNQNYYHVKDPGRVLLEVETYCGVLKDDILIKYDECECNPFVPTAFTPNNDGLNDKIFPIMGCDPLEYKFLIVNRFGEVVFRSTDPNGKWNGNYKGISADVGTYYYLLEVKSITGKTYKAKGDIILIR